MATGRTVLRNWRAYMDGYDLSGYTRSFGPLACTFEEGIDDAVTLTVKQTMIGSANVSMGTLNGLFDNTATSGLHAIMQTPGGTRNVMLACGIQTAPINYDPVFMGKFTQLSYSGDPDNIPVYATVTMGNMTNEAPNLAYSRPWGVLMHAKGAETAANTATGLDQLAATTLGGYMMYQSFAGNGTATIKIQDAAANSDGSFTDLLSSGSLDFSTPRAAIVALAKTATVKRYVRFQVAFGTATSVTFALAFSRGN